MCSGPIVDVLIVCSGPIVDVDELDSFESDNEDEVETKKAEFGDVTSSDKSADVAGEASTEPAVVVEGRCKLYMAESNSYT